MLLLVHFLEPLEVILLFHPFILAVLFFLLNVWLIFRFMSNPKRSNYRLPPCPSKFPIIGNLHQLGSSPHSTFGSLAQHHGPLMLLHLGLDPTLVVSSADAAQEIMKTHDLVFSNRPNLRIPKRLIYNNKDIAFAPYGEYWRQMRRIGILHLLSTKRVRSFRGVREEETALMIKKIERCCSSPSSSGLMDLSELLVSLTNDIICRVAFGRKYSGGEGGGKTFKVGDYIPWLGWVNYINGLNTRVEKVFREIDCFLGEVIEDHSSPHHRSREDDGVNDSERGKDCGYFAWDSKGLHSWFSYYYRRHKGIILDMFAAGTDTDDESI